MNLLILVLIIFVLPPGLIWLLERDHRGTSNGSTRSASVQPAGAEVLSERQLRAKQRRELIAELNAVPSPPEPGTAAIVSELRALGFDVQSVTDLQNSGVNYRKAVPVLIKGLQGADNPTLAEAIVRALSVPWAKPAAAAPLIEFFRNVDTMPGRIEGLRWAIGSALEIVGNDSVFSDLADLAQNRRYGRARQMIVLGLGKSKRPEAVSLLIKLADDPDVDGHAVAALRKLKTQAARSVFQSKLDDKRAWVRKEARKGLERLDSR